MYCISQYFSTLWLCFFQRGYHRANFETKQLPPKTNKQTEKSGNTSTSSVSAVANPMVCRWFYVSRCCPIENKHKEI